MRQTCKSKIKNGRPGIKATQKLPEPATLAAYRAAAPESSWEEMRNDPFNGGQGAYAEIKKTLVRGQRCLCAYCEIRVAADTSDAAVDADKSLQRVEHFHPKSDLTRPPNWALHWPNLWAVCMGGDQTPPVGEPINPAY